MIVKKLLVNDGRTEREVLLVGTVVVGRDPSCQLNDLDPLLSRRHAEFVPTGKGVTVRDLKSRNGILVNGDKVPEHALKPGDVIQLGHLHVRYVEEPVVKSPEDHSRVRAKTETGIEVPTMAPSPKVASPSAPAEVVATVKPTDDTDLDMTVAPQAKPPADNDDFETRLPADPLVLPKFPEIDLDATAATQALRISASPSLPASNTEDDDLDRTRVPQTAQAAALVEDPDATVAGTGISFDETRVPTASAQAPALSSRAPANTEARIVANMHLVVTEASPSCQAVIGTRPDTIVGGQLPDVIARTLRFVATGDGPSALSVSIARTTPGNSLTVTFKTATGNQP